MSKAGQITNMKIISAFLITISLITLISCSSKGQKNDPQYLSEVTFKFVDQDNNPLANREIIIDNDSTNEDREIALVLGVTDENGIIKSSKNEIREYKVEYYNAYFTLTKEDEGQTIKVELEIEDDINN